MTTASKHNRIQEAKPFVFPVPTHLATILFLSSSFFKHLHSISASILIIPGHFDHNIFINHSTNSSLIFSSHVPTLTCLMTFHLACIIVLHHLISLLGFFVRI
ncbi:hypothetical protein CC79DRAFT_576687 [Sarocladium strictum]